jgi:hypothetical protein
LTFRDADLARLLRRLAAAGIDVDRCKYELFKDHITIVPLAGPPIEVTTGELQQEDDVPASWEGAKPW